MPILNKKNNISCLLKEIKKLKLENYSGISRASYISDSIFSEWSKVIKNYRKLSYNKKFIRKSIFIDYEIKEELLIGLMVMLNEKLIYRLKVLINSEVKK